METEDDTEGPTKKEEMEMADQQETDRGTGQIDQLTKQGSGSQTSYQYREIADRLANNTGTWQID